MTTVAPAGDVNTTYLELSRHALAIDELVDRVEGWHLSPHEAKILGTPALHFRIALQRLEQAIFEVGQLDQRPRLERLRAA